MQRTLLLILVFLSVTALLTRFTYNPIRSKLGLAPVSGVRIEADTPAEVAVDSKSIGQTPAEEDNLSVGEHLIQVQSSQGNWQGYVTLYPGTKTIINRTLGPNEASSSGEIISLSQGKGIAITSNPSHSQVEMDGKVVGSTPLSLPDAIPGDHLFILSHDGYLNHSVRAVVVNSFTLKLAVDLAVAPLDNLYIPSPPDLSVTHLTVLQTSTGFLRVRSTPSLAGDEIEKVNPGDDLILLDEENGWDHVKLPDGKEGYVSGDYVQKSS